MIEIKSTLRQASLRIVVYGRNGVGKSTFFAAAPRAVFIAVESGLDNIDARAVPQPKDWTELLASVDYLATEPSCESIVIDSLDWAEQLCWAHIVATKTDDKGRRVKDIEGYGYGKGYIAALNEWRILLNALTIARDNGKNILLIAHSIRKAVKNPTGEDYEQWQIKINAQAAGLIQEWVDVVGFAELDVATIKEGEGQGKRIKGQSSGRRILRTQPAAGYEAKTRFALPAKIPLEWPAFAAAIAAGSYSAIPSLQATLAEKLSALGNADVSAGCERFLASRGITVASLNEAIATVDGYLSPTETGDAS